MGTKLLSSYDFVIIGGGISSYLLSALLAKKDFTIAVLQEHDLNESQIVESYSIIPLNYLRIHSIPYSEQSYKNKSTSTYVERFINLEKFFFPKLKQPLTLESSLFYNYKQLGIINHQLFFKFLISLVEKEENIEIITLNKNIQISKASENEELNQYTITIDENKELIPVDKLLLTDTMALEFFKKDLDLKNKESYKYIFKVNEILADSINHYFIPEGAETKIITLLPCAKYSIIEFVTDEKLDNPNSQKLITFLEEKFNLTFTDLEHITTEITFKHEIVNGQSKNTIIPQNFLLTFPFGAGLHRLLESIFSASIYFEEKNMQEYHNWLQKVTNVYEKFHTVFLAQNNQKNLHSFGKIINQKDINHLNIFSTTLINFRIGMALKHQNMTKQDIKNFFNLLTHSIIQ